MANSPYGPQGVRRVSLKRLPKAIRESAVSVIERKLETGTVTDLVTISDSDWHQACRRFNAIQRLAEHQDAGPQASDLRHQGGGAICQSRFSLHSIEG